MWAKIALHCTAKQRNHRNRLWRYHGTARHWAVGGGSYGYAAWRRDGTQFLLTCGSRLTRSRDVETPGCDVISAAVLSAGPAVLLARAPKKRATNFCFAISLEFWHRESMGDWYIVPMTQLSRESYQHAPRTPDPTFCLTRLATQSCFLIYKKKKMHMICLGICFRHVKVVYCVVAAMLASRMHR